MTGWFSEYLGRPRQGLMGLHSNGRLDETFNPRWDTNCVPGSIALAADGKIVIGGWVRDHFRGFVARFDAAGGLDSSFHHGFAQNGVVQSIQVLSNNCIFVAGEFKYFDGVYAPGFVVLDPDGRVPARPSEWIEWPKSHGGNGHHYALTSRAVSWTNAEAEAKQLGGHLVAIGDAAEQAFLERTFLKGELKVRPLWIGLNYIERQGQFAWSNGEAVTYANWSSEEPNHNAGEYYTCLNWHFSSGDHRGELGEWNDAPLNGTDYGARAEGPYFGIIERTSKP